MKNLILATVVAALLTGCSTMTPTAVRPLTAVATAATLQYAVPTQHRIPTARNIVLASTLYERYSAGNIPTPAQFNLVLDDVIPNNQSKPITIVSLSSLYAAYYPRFSGGLPAVQLEYLTNFMLGTRDGALAFIPTTLIRKL